MELANQGVTYNIHGSFIKDLMVLEFVGIPEKTMPDIEVLQVKVERVVLEYNKENK